MAGGGRGELISRHLQQGATLEDELTLLSKQPAEKQAVMLERLEVLDKYLSLASASVEDVDAAAAQLDVSRRQFYRLLAKLKSLGPVRALVRGMQNVARASAARDGLAEPIEAVLIEALLKEPDAKIAKLESLLSARGLTPPKEWILRQRVHALRSSGMINPDSVFGGRVVVDQISIDLPVPRASGIVRFGTLTAIIDRSTRLVLGASISVDGWDAGLEGALYDMRRIRVPMFNEQRFPIAVRLSELTWVVPPGLERFVGVVAEGATTNAQAPTASVISQGPRRHGEFIMRLLGDRLGPYAFRTRSVPGLDAECPERSGTPLEDAQIMIGHCVDAWNRKLLPHLPMVMDSDIPKRTRRLNRVVRDVDTFFKPVMEHVEEWFERPRPVAEY